MMAHMSLYSYRGVPFWTHPQLIDDAFVAYIASKECGLEYTHMYKQTQVKYL